MNDLGKVLKVEIKDSKLFTRALTHASKSKDNYERLEFLGDSILDFLVGEYLYKHSDKGEGYLTVMRSHFVSENNLAEVFDKLGLEKYVLMGKSMAKNISKAVKGDVVEAIIGAIYLDSGLSAVKSFIERELDLKNFALVKDTNYKSHLQELVQAGFKCAIRYNTVKCEGGFTSTFYMDEDAIATASGPDKTSAEQACAQKAIKILFKE